jgi:hypothetical protein
MTRTNDRYGYLLLELLVVMTVATVLLGLTAGWIFQTMKFATATKQRQSHHQNLTQLGWALRDDVHASNSMSMDGVDMLVLEFEVGLQVTYTIRDTELLIEKRDNQPIIKRERFELARDSTVVWDTSEMPDWISLIVYRGSNGAESLSPAETEPTLVATESTPVDLHVRVGPNRWAVKTADGRPSNNETKEPK